jgi:EmrB/QacA subfamily drug resistance transporter
MTIESLSADEHNRRNRVHIIIGVICGAFLAALDTTILSTVMPTIVSDLGGLGLYSWVFSVYMIMTAIAMPVWGKVSDSVGRKSVFFAAVAVFLIGSILCGMSRTMVHLIVFRGIQGIGAGGLASVPFALISTVYPPRERGKALGLLSSVWGVASVVGPLAGSLILLHLDWRWVFYVNIPGGIAAIVIVGARYREEPDRHREQIDYGGALLLCVTIVALLLGFLLFGRGEMSMSVISLFAGSGAFLFLFIWRERRAKTPILQLTYFTRKAFWVGNLLGFIASFAMYGVIAFMPLFAQSVLQGTAFSSGLVITSMSLSWSLASVVAGRLVYRWGERRLIRTGLLVMFAGFLLSTAITAMASTFFLILCVVVIGAGMGAQMPSLMLSVQHSLDAKNVGVATSTHMLARTIGGAIGVSVMGSVVSRTMNSRFSELSAAGLLGGFPESVRAHLRDPQELLSAYVRPLLSDDNLATVLTAFAGALHQVFVVGLFVVLAGILVGFLLPPSALQVLPADSPAATDC